MRLRLPEQPCQRKQQSAPSPPIKILEGAALRRREARVPLKKRIKKSIDTQKGNSV
jgi:hypothetical protein